MHPPYFTTLSPLTAVRWVKYAITSDQICEPASLFSAGHGTTIDVKPQCSYSSVKDLSALTARTCLLLW